MLTNEHFTDLKEKGYTVINDVVSKEDCDTAICQYQEWLSQFKDGDWPFSMNSLIQRYNTGHMEPTWSIRLKTKSVFEQIWNTNKLFTSVDAIAIGRPPEESEEQFFNPGMHWLHLDQNENRAGLHAYQGAVYLEEACEDDWTLFVMERSHKYFEEFYAKNEKARLKSNINLFYAVRDKDIKFMEDRGCQMVRVAVPKGGMVLWDSRLVHANANPKKGRAHPGRWRYCVFVCMTPAVWACKRDLRMRQKAYREVSMTTHWPSQGVNLMKTYTPSYAPKYVTVPTKIPQIARSKEAKQLAGVVPYNFADGLPCGEDQVPVWKEGWPLPDIESSLPSKTVLLSSSLAGAAAIAAGFIVYNKFK